MTRLLSALILLLTFAALSPAQSLSEYLKIRKSFKITQAVPVEALESFVGVRVMELKARVKGSMSVGSTTSLLVDRADGKSLIIEGATIPDWLNGNEIDARLIVRAERRAEMGEIRATLIAAASEADVAAVDAKAAAAKKPPVKPKKNSQPVPKDNNPLRGPIGRTPRGGSGQLVLSSNAALPYYVDYIMRRNRRLNSVEADRIARGVIGFSLRNGVDARLIMAIVMVESGFNPNATSRAGAQGLGQLMPGTARGMGVGNSYDSIENLYGTVRLIRGHLDKYKKSTGDDYQSLVLALAAYNAGGGAVRKHGGVPPYKETQNYVRKVISLYNKLCGY